MKACPICNKELTRVESGALKSKVEIDGECTDVLVENLSYSKCNNCNEIFFSAEESKNYELQLNKAFREQRKQVNHDSKLLRKNRNVC